KGLLAAMSRHACCACAGSIGLTSKKSSASLRHATPPFLLMLLAMSCHCFFCCAAGATPTVSLVSAPPLMLMMVTASVTLSLATPWSLPGGHDFGSDAAAGTAVAA